MQTPLSTRISVETMTALKQYAEQTGKSLASIVDAALKEYLDREGKQ